MNYSIFRETVLVATQTIVGSECFDTISLPLKIFTTVIMMIRVYALYGRDQRILWFMLGFALCVVGLSVVCFIFPKACNATTNSSGSSIRSLNSTLHVSWSWEAAIMIWRRKRAPSVLWVHVLFNWWLELKNRAYRSLSSSQHTGWIDWTSLRFVRILGGDHIRLSCFSLD